MCGPSAVFAVHTVSFDKSLTSLILNFLSWIFQYHKVVSTSTSRLEANDGFFRLSMKGNLFDISKVSIKKSILNNNPKTGQTFKKTDIVNVQACLGHED